MSRTIKDLREKLFDTIDALTRDKDPMEIDRAEAVVQVADSIIESAKVEVAAMKIAGGPGTGFVDTGSATPAIPDQRPRGHERLSAVKTRA